MNRVSKDGILKLQILAQDLFPSNITKGKPNIGKIESIADKPFFTPFGIKKYDTIYKKAACYIESIIRSHPFTDGNKRTAILVAYKFLESNRYYLVIPIDAVKYLVTIAKELKMNEEDIDDLIKNIADWLEVRTSTTLDGYTDNLTKYVVEPWTEVNALWNKGDNILALEKIKDWFVTDTEFKFENDMEKIAKFYEIMVNMTTETILRDKRLIDYLN